MAIDELEHAGLTGRIIGAAIEVHKIIGPGLKEEVYRDALEVELGLRGLKTQKEVPVHCVYKGVSIDDHNHPKRADLIVEGIVVVECKALMTQNEPCFKSQCLTYLKMLGLEMGLVINFGRPTLKEGVARVVNTRNNLG